MCILNLFLRNSKIYKKDIKLINMVKNVTYKLNCEHYKEVGVFGAGCSAENGYPYKKNYQTNDGPRKGCRISGLISISDLPEDLKRRLDKGLVERVELSIQN